MTSMHTLFWLRRYYSMPWSRDAWPERTVMDGPDVRVDDVSMLGVAQAVGTPCVRTASAIVPALGGVPSRDKFASVVVTRVQEVEDLVGDRLGVWVDAELDGCRPILRECRLVGRVSDEPMRVARMYSHTAEFDRADVVLLPGDLHEGDLVAVPCRGATALHDIARHRLPYDTDLPRDA